MSQNNNPNPPAISQSELDLVIGRKVIGPFKRLLTKQVEEAQECVRVSELLIRDYINDPEKEPSEDDVKLLESFVNRLQRHRNLMEAIPALVEDKMNSPTVVASSRRQTFADEVKALLEKAKYPGTVSDLSKTFELYEQVFNSKGIQMIVSPQGPPASDHESAEEGDVSKKGSSTVSPRTQNSTNAKFVYDEPDYLDRSIDLEYLNELKAKAAAMVAQGNTKAREIDESNPIPTVPSGLNDSVVSIENTIRERVVPQRIQNISEHTAAPKQSPANSIYAAPIKAQEPKYQFPSDQLKSDQIIPPELMADIIYNIERNQVEKERENNRARDLLLQEAALLRQERHALRLERENSGRIPNEPEEPKRYTPKPEKFKRSPKPEIKPESKNPLFTSSSESDEEASYDEEDTSQYYSDSDYRYATGYDNQHKSKQNLRKKVSPPSQIHRQKKVKLDDVRKNLITFNGTGRLENFRTIFNDEVMDNDDIKPLMKATLLEQHLKGKALEYMYDLADPLEAIKRTFQDLQKAFGGKADKMTLHEKFNSLQFHKTDSEKMIADIAAHRKVMAQLEEKKVDINDVRSITTFTKKLPSQISDKVVKYLAKTKDGDVTFDKVLDIVEAQIRVIKTSKSVFGENKIQGSNELPEPLAASVHYTNPQALQYQPQQKGGNKPHGNPQSQNSGYKGKPHNGGNQKGKKPVGLKNPQPAESMYDAGKPEPKWNTVSWSFPFGTPEQGQKCVACEGAHNMIRCPLPSAEFRKKLQEKNHCERCTRHGHKASECQQWYKCAYCCGDHAMGGCPQKEFYRKRENIPRFCVIKDENSPRKRFFRGNGKSQSQ